MSGEHGTETGTNSDSTKGEPKVVKEYSTESRTFRAYYDELGTLRYMYTSQHTSLTFQSFNAPTSEATIRGAVKTA
jgi:hypothetical protein